jgi:hypothetical protein
MPEEPLPPPLTEALVITLGLWDPRYAHLKWINEQDGFAFAVVDTNGDGQQVEVSLFRCSDGAWEEFVTGPGSGYTENVVWECGYRPGQQAVEVVYHGAERKVPVTPSGMWYFAAARPVDDPDPVERPTLRGAPKEFW